MSDRLPDAASERRLEEVRREAEQRGRVSARGIRPPGAPFPEATPENGYYGLPLLKEPVWTWEVPAYFFVGGAAGAAAVVAAAAQVTGADDDLVRDARWVAAAGAVLSGPLLVADLGRRARFLNMLRVFKVQSPMSVGAWTLTAFGAASSAAAFADLVRRKTGLPVTLIADAAGLLAGATGLGMATYTGVLIGATSIPAWSSQVRLLPIHFGASGLASAVSILELMGRSERALNVLGLTPAIVETAIGIAIESSAEVATEPLRRGATGWTMRAAGFFSGPVPLVLRMLGGRSRRHRRAAAACSLLGSLITRIAWIEAGRASARDSRVPLDLAHTSS